MNARMETTRNCPARSVNQTVFNVGRLPEGAALPFFIQAASSSPASAPAGVSCVWLSGLSRENLAGIEDVVRIKRPLDRAHHLQRLAMFARHELRLAHTNAMFAGSRPA